MVTYKDYNIIINRQTSHVDVIKWEGNIKNVNPDNHKLISQNITITLEWVEQIGSMSTNAQNRKVNFYNIVDFDSWINKMVSSCDTCDASFRQFLAWLENRLAEAKALQTVK